MKGKANGMRILKKPGWRLLQIEGLTDPDILAMSDDECQKRCREIHARDKAIATDPNTVLPEPEGERNPNGGMYRRAGYTTEQWKALSRGQRIKLHKKLMRKEIKEGWIPTPEQKRATTESVRQFLLAVDRVPFTARELVDALSTLTPGSDTSTRIRVACTLQAMQAGSQKCAFVAEAEAAFGKTISEVIREFD